MKVKVCAMVEKSVFEGEVTNFAHLARAKFQTSPGTGFRTENFCLALRSELR